MRSPILAALTALLLGIPGVAQAALDSSAPIEKELRILRITPEGVDVPTGRQIVIEFNRPVVPVGRMERTAEEIPISIKPALKCEWRWLDTSSLSCNLGEKDALVPSTTYEMHIQPGIRAEDGITIAEPLTHRFTTERADVRYSWFKTWKSPGLPVIRAVFNQPVTQESVEDSLYLTMDGSKLMHHIRAAKDPDDSEKPIVLPLPGEKMVAINTDGPRKSDDQAGSKGGIETRRVWLIEPEQELPLDKAVTLKIKPGLVSALGAEMSVAERDIVQFNTFPEFKFLGVKCRTNLDQDVLITPESPQKPEQKCNPLGYMALAFNSPVFRAEVKKAVIFTPGLSGKKDFDPWGEYTDYSSLGQPYRKEGTYDVYLPSVFKAASAYTVGMKVEEKGFFARLWEKIIALFQGEKPKLSMLQDEFGRQLPVPPSIQFATDHRKPNFEILHHEAILEKEIESELPLYVTNLKTATLDFRSVTPEGAKENQKRTITPAAVQDLQFALPFGVRDALGGKTGALFGYLSTDPVTVGKSNYDRRLFAAVTPYQMHVKLGHFSTLVWVTDLATGEAVKGATVSVYPDSLTTLGSPKDVLATATTDDSGIASFPGTDVLDPELLLARGWSDESPKLFVRVDKDGDMALMPLSGDFSIDTWRASGETIWEDTQIKYGHLRTWGTTAQGIYRAGDTIQYKFYVRHQDDRSLVAAQKDGYTLTITDPTGKTVETVTDVKLNEFGAYSGEYKVSEHGAVGWYQFQLKPAYTDLNDKDEADTARSWSPMRVLVSDFTPSSFKVSTDLNGDLFAPEQQVEVSTAATLHSGGAYTQASARITAILDSQGFYSKHPLAQAFTFDSYLNEAKSQQLFQTIQPLNDKGELATTFSTANPNIVYGTLTVESAVQDDRGKYIASQKQASYAGVDRLVGLRSTQWVYEAGKPAKIEYIVVDGKGAPASGTAVAVTVEQEVTTAARVKGAGNAYITNFNTEWKKVEECSGTSTAEALSCEFTPKVAGTYKLTASIKDTKGRDHSSKVSVWATGSDYVLWKQDSDSYLTIVPEKTEYRVGDTARYLVKNPFPGAKALITVERYGIIDHFVQTFDSNTPIVEFPVKPDYLPGYYLSVTVISPRVEKPLGEGNVDLGKPTFRMGYVSVPVNDPYKEMKITATPDQDVYRPRDKVSVKLHAEPRKDDKKEPIEFAVAVLDEAVLDLVAGGKSYYDPYRGFYNLESLDLRNFSLLTRLIGRQKFEKKGANPGGDGGSDLSMRTLFKFVSYWNPSLKADTNGNAEISFDVPDNLTGWRILAIAVTPSDRFGLGDASFKVNRPTEVRPVMPNQVTEGDRFEAAFSVMNRTDKKRTLNVTIHADGLIDTSKTPAEVTKEITLEPYKRTTVSMPVETLTVKADRDVSTGFIHFTARASDAEDSDGMEQTLKVEKRRSLVTAATYGTTEQDKAETSIAFPQNIQTDVGSVSVVASPTVIANVDGAFRYLRDYPYTCWEQRLTRGVMAAHYKNLLPYMEKDFWKNSAELPQQMLDQAVNFQTPSGGMAFFTPRDEYADPYLSAYTALGFNWMRHAGYKVPGDVETRLHRYLIELLKRDATPDFYSDGMRSTVRAVALAALSESGQVTLSDLERYLPHVKGMSLFGKAHFLKAALNVSDAEKIAAEVSKMILAHASQSGGKFSFNETLDDSYARILATPLRDNCSILDAFTAYGETTEGAELVGDVPFKLTRSITQSRGQRDYWENTQENMFCMKALIEFSRIYEKTAPKMQVKASLDGTTFGEGSFKAFTDKPLTFERPLAVSDPGKKSVVEIDRAGDGRLYYATRLTYAPKTGFDKPTNAGMELVREYSVERDGKWVLLKSPVTIKRGELVRVDLYLSLPTARNFVVLEDSVPGGLEPVNRDLANSSTVDAKKGEFEASGGSWWFNYSNWMEYSVSRWNFYHQEIRHNSVRYYSDYLPAGNYHLSYTAQAIAPGEFTIMPAHAEEMYDPDVFGKGISEALVVQEK